MVTLTVASGRLRTVNSGGESEGEGESRASVLSWACIRDHDLAGQLPAEQCCLCVLLSLPCTTHTHTHTHPCDSNHPYRVSAYWIVFYSVGWCEYCVWDGYSMVLYVSYLSDAAIDAVL